MLDLHHAAVRYRLGLVDTESLVRMAHTLAEEGRDSVSAIKLIALESPILAEAGPLFEAVCAEHSIEIPTVSEAISQLLRHHLESIATGAQPAYEGLHCIMLELYWPHISREPVIEFVGDSRGLSQLIGAYWGYDDLRGRPDEVSFNGRYGAEAIACLDESVREDARAWLRTHAPTSKAELETAK